MVVCMTRRGVVLCILKGEGGTENREQEVYHPIPDNFTTHAARAPAKSLRPAMMPPACFSALVSRFYLNATFLDHDPCLRISPRLFHFTSRWVSMIAAVRCHSFFDTSLAFVTENPGDERGQIVPLAIRT